MSDANKMSLLRTTLATEDQAKKTARRLLGQGACCVHVHRIESIYPWDGEVKEEAEWAVEARVPADLAESAWAWLMKNHPYDIPLVELIPETRVNGKYARWAQSLRE